MAFVIIMILFDVKDYRLLYGLLYIIGVFGTKARMGTYRIQSSLDRVESLMFQNLLQPASNNTTR